VSLLEQLLVAWPLFVTALCWICRRSLSGVTVLVWAAFGAAAAIGPVMFDGANGDRLYLGTDSHAVAFVAGAAVGCTAAALDGRRGHRDRGRRRGHGTAAAVFVTVCGGCVLFLLVTAAVLMAWPSQRWLYQGGLAVIGGLAALLVAILCYERGPLFRIFSWGPLVEFGKLSYQMYLLHLPIYWLLKTTKPGMAGYELLLVGGGLTWLVAMIVHYAIAYRLRLRTWSLRIGVPVAVASVLVAMSAYYLPGALTKQMNPGGRPVVLTLGDSVAGDVALALANHGTERFGVVDGSIADCGVVYSDQMGSGFHEAKLANETCRDWDQSWRLAIRESQPEFIIVRLGTDATQQHLNGRSYTPCDAAYRNHYTGQLEKASRIWAEEAPRARVLFMNEAGTATTDDAMVRCYNAIVERFAVAQAQVKLVDLEGFLCGGAACREQTGEGEPLYYSDRVHLAHPGMREIGRWLEQQLRNTD
jgi:lysophospholipase L1-like esterase